MRVGARGGEEGEGRCDVRVEQGVGEMVGREKGRRVSSM